jgi:hypothetical protein
VLNVLTLHFCKIAFQGRSGNAYMRTVDGESINVNSIKRFKIILQKLTNTLVHSSSREIVHVLLLMVSSIQKLKPNEKFSHKSKNDLTLTDIEMDVIKGKPILRKFSMKNFPLSS